jgi:hypothetical protein
MASALPRPDSDVPDDRSARSGTCMASSVWAPTGRPGWSGGRTTCAPPGETSTSRPCRPLRGRHQGPEEGLGRRPRSGGRGGHGAGEGKDGVDQRPGRRGQQQRHAGTGPGVPDPSLRYDRGPGCACGPGHPGEGPYGAELPLGTPHGFRPWSLVRQREMSCLRRRAARVERAVDDPLGAGHPLSTDSPSD